jgi:hypothetical protein
MANGCVGQTDAEELAPVDEVVPGSHDASWGLLAADGIVATTICTREALLAYVSSAKRLTAKLSAIRFIDRGASDRSKASGGMWH